MGRDLQQRAMAQPAQQGNQPKPLTAQIRTMEKQFELAMPKGMEATQLVRDALTCLGQTPQLAECEQSTVLGALMSCAQLGLRPGVLGQAYLLPLWNSKNRRREAQLVIGYAGLTELIHRSGAVQMIASRVVYSNDEFMFEYGLAEDKLIHRPPTSGPRGNPVAFYAIARMKDGGYAMTDVMSVADMEAYRDKYAMAKKKDGTVVGPWVSEFVPMAQKTMIRQLAKMLPKSPEVQRAITHDGAVRVDYTPAGIDSRPDYIDAEPSPAVTAATPDDPPAAAADEPPFEPDPPQEAPTTENPTDTPAPAPTAEQLKALDAAFTAQKYSVSDGSREEWLSNLIGDQITNVRDLTGAEVQHAIDTLTGK